MVNMGKTHLIRIIGVGSLLGLLFWGSTESLPLPAAAPAGRVLRPAANPAPGLETQKLSPAILQACQSDRRPKFPSPIGALPAEKAVRKTARLTDPRTLEHLEGLIKKYARLHGVDENLVWAVIRQESGCNPGAVSPKGAMGLMQLMPGTAAMMGVSNPFDVEQNLAGGIKYLGLCLDQFDQDVSLTLAAYNAGPENVVKYQGCPPFPETQHYVAAVLEDYSGPQPQRGLRARAQGLASPPEVAEPAKPSGLQWNLPTPVVKVSKPQWRLPPPRWHDLSRPGRLQAMAAKSTRPNPPPRSTKAGLSG
jgi:hypothetical protein